jgi:hypothetical protein
MKEISRTQEQSIREQVASSAVFGIEESFSIFSVHIELVSFAFDIEK